MFKLKNDLKMISAELLGGLTAQKDLTEVSTASISNKLEDENQLRDLMEFLAQEIEEPLDTLGLRELLVGKYQHLLKYEDITQNIDGKLRSILSSEDRTHTVNILLSGPRRIIGTFIDGRVGGLIFNAQHKDTVEEVIRVKSRGGADRQRVFALVSTIDFSKEIIDPSLLKDIRLENLAGVCFVQLPVIPSAIERLPSEVVTLEESSKATVQFFMTPVNSPLEEIVRGSSEKDPQALFAGTSANFSNTPSLTNRVHTAVFSLHHGISYFDHPGYPDKAKRGSFSIVRINSNAEMTIVREGNRSLNYLKSRLHQ
ncbi:MAG: hypothetical protein UX19_C0002G0064 [Candidatus Woesebacteria bacterium GW2011_GWA1_45_8]|uniref:Uncharacterized protein n=1 Tax=Candidatus Woesebacteria bacterium GW2011_GWA1_45_8 TaxID=1618559 RepID=A0A0G1MVZ5_9BACT|nr:MAG: hypothetical protein UX19_C0002G0064 [Candidatus Woesebacteria bacterium GW2011_GWA1_45_8]